MNELCDGTLVFSSPGVLSAATAEGILQRLKQQFPGHRVIVLENGCELVCLAGDRDDEGDQGDTEAGGGEDSSETVARSLLVMADGIAGAHSGDPCDETGTPAIASQDGADIDRLGPRVFPGAVIFGEEDGDRGGFPGLICALPPAVSDLGVKDGTARGTHWLRRVVVIVPELTAKAFASLHKFAGIAAKAEQAAILTPNRRHAAESNR